MPNTDQVQSRVTTDVSQSVTALKKLQAELFNLQDKYKALGKTTKKNKEEKAALSAEIDKQKAKLSDERRAVGASVMSYNELLRYKKDLAKAYANLSPLQDDYNEKMAENLRLNKEVNAELAKRKALGAESKGAFDFLKSSLPGAIAGGVGGALVGLATGAISTGISLLDQYGQRLANTSDELADVALKTNLTEQEVRALNDALNNRDTRTSSKDLRLIAQIGGDLNVAQSQLEGFVESVDKLNVAFGRDLGSLEQAAETTGKIVGQFKQFDGQAIGNSIEAVGSGIKALADDGPATVKTISEFTLRIGQLPEKLRPAAAETLAYAAVLEEAGLTAEISSGGLTNLLLTAAKNTDAFAKFFRMSKKEFEAFLNANPNEFLIKLAESFKNADPSQLGNGLKSLKIDSQESVKVIGTLSDNLEKLRQKQALANAAVSEATLLTEAFNVKNSTLAAEMEKLGKRIASFSLFTGFGEFLRLVLADINDRNPAKSLASLTAEFEDQDQKAKSLQGKLLPLADRYDQLRNKVNRTAAEQTELNRITAQITGIMPSAATQVDKYGNVLSINTARVREFVEAQRAMAKVLNRDAIQASLEANKRQWTELNKLIAERNRLSNLPRNARGEMMDVRAGSVGIGDRGAATLFTEADIAALDKRIAKLKAGTRETYLAWKGLRGELGEIANDPKTTTTNDKLLGIPTTDDSTEADKRLQEQLDKLFAFAEKRAALLADEQEREETQAAIAATRELEAFKGTEDEKAEYAELISEQLRLKIEEIRKKFADRAAEEAKKEAKRQLEIQNKILADKAQRAVNSATRAAGDGANTDLGVYNARRKQLLALQEIDLSNTELTADERLNIEANYIDKLDALWQEFYTNNAKAAEDTRKTQQSADEKYLADLRDRQSQNAELAGKAFSAGFNIYASRLQQKEQQEQKAANKQMKRIDEQVKFGLLSEEAAEKAKEALDAKAEARNRKYRREQAIAERANAVFTATIQGIINVIRAINPAAKLRAGIEASLAVGTLLATPIPEFYEGGFTPTDSPTRDRKGRKVGGVVHTNEYVVSEKMLSMPFVPDVVNALEAIRTNQTTPANAFGRATASTDPAMLKLIAANTTAIEQLNERLDQGITATGVWEWEAYRRGVDRMSRIEADAKAQKNRY